MADPTSLVRQSAEGFIAGINRVVLSQVGRAMAQEVGQGLGVSVEQMAKTFENNRARQMRKQTNEQIAAKMRQAIIASYNATIEANKVVPSYRLGRNRLPGALGAALEDPALIKSGIDGIDYNSAVLSRRARHWARLNYGVAPRGAGGGRSFNILGTELSIAAPPRPPMTIPPGVFFNPRTGKIVRPRRGRNRSTVSQFFPTGRTPMRPTRGVEGANYLDAGLEVLARDLPGAYADLAFRIVTEATPKKVQKDVRVRLG